MLGGDVIELSDESFDVTLEDHSTDTIQNDLRVLLDNHMICRKAETRSLGATSHPKDHIVEDVAMACVEVEVEVETKVEVGFLIWMPFGDWTRHFHDPHVLVAAAERL